MRLISPLLKHVVFPSLAKAGYLNRRIGAGPAILTYHGVPPKEYQVLDPALDGSLVTAESLRRQLKLLKQQYNVITPEQFRQWCESGQELPPRSVLLTCDDGLRNAQTEMLPILQEFQLSCLFSVTGASLFDTPSMLWHEELYLMFLSCAGPIVLRLEEIALGPEVTKKRAERRSLWWSLIKSLSRFEASARLRLLQKIRNQLGLAEDWNEKYLRDPAGRKRFLLLDAEGVKKLRSSGMSLSAHTLSHPMLSQLSPGAAWREIAESRRGLEQVLGEPVWALAYPFGDANSVTQREMKMAEQAGFCCAFLNISGGFGAETPRFALPRVHVTAEMSLAEFQAHLSGLYRSLRRHFLGDDRNAAMEPVA